jgi:hypothetical protein
MTIWYDLKNDLRIRAKDDLVASYGEGTIYRSQLYLYAFAAFFFSILPSDAPMISLKLYGVGVKMCPFSATSTLGADFLGVESEAAGS